MEIWYSTGSDGETSGLDIWGSVKYSFIIITPWSILVVAAVKVLSRDLFEN